jgi:uncharacterized protein
MTGPVAAMLPDGRRLHLQHGPIDLIVGAWGDASEVRAAYGQAARCFEDVLSALVSELAILRRPLNNPLRPRSGGRGCERSERVRWVSPRRDADQLEGGDTTSPFPPSLRFGGPLPSPPLRGGEGEYVCGSVARRMIAACMPFRDVYITPMAAVAGAVADHVLAAMCEGRTLERAFVNDGGDIAFHLAPGQRLSCGLVADLAAPGLDGNFTLTSEMPVRGLATSGRATKGSGGRSFSLGIADAVTVLARDAAAADAAATIIANAVDLPGHAAITRVPASSIDPDSDLGDIPVTVDLGMLTEGEIAQALSAGVARAEALRQAGHIHGAVLVLRRRFAGVGTGLPRLAAA